MLEDDVVAATKRMVASTSDNRGDIRGKGKGKRSRQNRDVEQEQSNGVTPRPEKVYGMCNRRIVYV